MNYNGTDDHDKRPFAAAGNPAKCDTLHKNLLGISGELAMMGVANLTRIVSCVFVSPLMKPLDPARAAVSPQPSAVRMGGRPPSAVDPASPRDAADPEWAVWRVARTIREDYRRSLTVTSLARECGLSERSLHRHYRAWTGKTVGRDLLDRRLEVAAELLRRQDAKLEQVAVEVGLGSAKNLCRLFKLHIGITPGRWKEDGRRTGGWTS